MYGCGAVNDLCVDLQTRIHILKPSLQVKGHETTGADHQHDFVLQEQYSCSTLALQSVCWWEPAYSPLAYSASDQPDPAVISQSQRCLRRGKQMVVSGAWGSVLRGYGEDAAVGKDGPVAIEEGAECCMMLGIQVKEEVDLLR